MLLFAYCRLSFGINQVRLYKLHSADIVLNLVHGKA